MWCGPMKLGLCKHCSCDILYFKDIIVTVCTVFPPLDLVEIELTHSMEDIGPVQSATTTDQRDHANEFAASDFDGNDLTGGNLKMLTHSLKALAKEGDKPQDADVALDVRPTLVQASNLLVRVI